MFTFPLIALAATALLFFVAVPVVLFALMLETCANRAAKVAVQPVAGEAPRSLPLPLHAAA